MEFSSKWLQVSGPGHVDDEAPSRLAGDQFHFVEEGVESGAAYSFTIVPVSTGYQAEITGPGATVSVQT